MERLTEVTVLVERRSIVGHTREEGEGQPTRNQSFGELLPGVFIDLVSLFYTAWRKQHKHSVVLTNTACTVNVDNLIASGQ